MGSRSKGVVKPPRNIGYRIGNQVGYLLRRAYQRSSSNLSDRISSYDITPQQFSVLAKLRESGSRSQNRLGRLVAMEPANIKKLVRRLQQRGLIELGSESTDRRLLIVSLSDAGKRLADELIPLSEAAVSDTMKPLNAEEKRTLLDLLRRIGGNATEDAN